MWAATRVEEYLYRKHFHLSKSQMAEEPLEDIQINLKIMSLIQQKNKSDQAVMEAKARSGK